jgi:hypothetical protein
VSAISVHATSTYPRTVSFTGTISEPNAITEVISLIERLPLVRPGVKYHCVRSGFGELELELQFLRSGQAELAATAFGRSGGCDWLNLTIGETHDWSRWEALQVIHLVAKLVGTQLLFRLER